jgi:hypothetical protein
MMTGTCWLGAWLSAAFSAAALLAQAQTTPSDTPTWRTSLAAFVKEVERIPLEDVPSADVEAGERTGERASVKFLIMQRLGGPVEWEGKFLGMSTVNVPNSPWNGRQKIDLAMEWPSGDANSLWKLHLYPKADSLRAWRALTPNTRIRFRAVVTGITRYQSTLPVPHLRPRAVLLEEGELVSQVTK